MPDDLEGWILWALVWVKENAEKWEYDFINTHTQRLVFVS